MSKDVSTSGGRSVGKVPIVDVGVVVEVLQERLVPSFPPLCVSISLSDDCCCCCRGLRPELRGKERYARTLDCVKTCLPRVSGC